MFQLRHSFINLTDVINYYVIQNMKFSSTAENVHAVYVSNKQFIHGVKFAPPQPVVLTHFRRIWLKSAIYQWRQTRTIADSCYNGLVAFIP